MTQRFDLIAHLHRQREFSARAFGPGARTWPDWRTAEPGKAIEHVRDEGKHIAIPHFLRKGHDCLRNDLQALLTCDTLACNDGTSLKIIRIVLTVAHVHDHRPEACDDANLAHLCQRCHLRHDVDHHKQNAYATRRARLAVGDLFETV